MNSPDPEGFQIGVTLDALMTFLKSFDFSGHLKEVYGGQGATRCQMWSLGVPMNSPDPEASKLVSYLILDVY